MSYSLSVPFYTIQLKIQNGGTLTVPLTESYYVTPQGRPKMILQFFEEAFQKKVIDKGEYQKILEAHQEGIYQRGKISVPFLESKDRFSYPALELSFLYFYKKTKNGLWSVVPALGLEAFGIDEEALEKALLEAIQLEFARKKRLKSVREIIPTLWYEAQEIAKHEAKFIFYTPAELEDLRAAKKEEILPRVATEVILGKKTLFGMEDELLQLAKALGGKFNKSVVLVGKSGVGKTTLVWELARQRRKFKINSRFWESTASTMIKELTGNTGWQDNLIYLCKELTHKGDILFVRNLLELFEVGQYVGNSVSMADYLKPFLSRGELVLITECTDEEYAKIELRSPNFFSFFTIIKVEEPRENLEQIILNKVQSISKIKGVKIEHEAIEETIRLNRRFTPYSGFPGKPIRFLESILINHSGGNEAPESISRSGIIRHFCEESGMPAFMVDPLIQMKTNEVKQQFKQQLFGQNDAIDKTVNMLSTVKTALSRQGKPIASFLFVGPTGVGKTEMAKLLAEFMFGSREKMLRFDMSEYAHPNAVMRLIGESYHQDGLLTAAVRREPFAVLLFDEIEKASPLFYDFLLQILGEGRLTDSAGRLVNFCSSIIIMTSNIGASSLQTGKVSFNKSIDVEEVSQHFETAVQKHFRPELYNRIDQIIPFKPLLHDTIHFVVDRELALLKKREGILFRNLELKIEEDVIEYLGNVGYDAKYGARQLQRVIRKEIINPLAHELNLCASDDQVIVSIKIENNRPKIDLRSDPLKFELMLETLARDGNVDRASDLRRNIYGLQEGNYYIRLLSNLEQLETKKRKKKEDFWKNAQDVRQYTKLQKTKTQVEKLTKEAEQIELKLSLSIMGLELYKPEIIDSIKACEKEFLDLKQEIYRRLHPRKTSCFFIIYGFNLKPILDFYFELFRKKRFDYKAETIWYRDEYFNEKIKKTIVEEDGEDGTVLIEQMEKRQEYLFKDYLHNDVKKLMPLKKDDILCGIKIEIFDGMASLFLKPECCLQRWQLSEKDINKYIVKSSETKPEIPLEIHRKNYYGRKAGAARRVVEPNFFKDPKLEINKELDAKEHLNAVIDKLEQLFSEELNKELIGGEKLDNE